MGKPSECVVCLVLTAAIVTRRVKDDALLQPPVHFFTQDFIVLAGGMKSVVHNFLTTKQSLKAQHIQDEIDQTSFAHNDYPASFSVSQKDA